MQAYKRLLLANKSWAAEKLMLDEHYFDELAADQKPEFLWIGCADSRVPANEVTGTAPGELFVHRNVANLVIHTDINMLSVLQYAVEVLKVKHILVVGHYGCGGVKASMTSKDYGLINKWLRNIKDVYHHHNVELDGIADEDKRFDRLVELNVIEQVKNLSRTTIVQRSWHQRQYPHLHGWVFDLHTGLINPIVEILPGAEVDPIYRYEFEEIVKKQDDLAVHFKH
jgi:carbonic anhydrase